MENEFKNYKRELIQISRDVVVLLHIFEKDQSHSCEDMSLLDNDSYDESIHNLRKESAKQFLKQFEGNECISFIKALRDECNNYLTRDKEAKELMKQKYENRCNK